MFVNDPTFWQGRAADVHAMAIQMTDPLSRSAMLALAVQYERLAHRIATGSDIFDAVERPAAAVGSRLNDK